MSKARNLATLLTTDGSVKTTKYVDSVGGQSDFVASGTLPNGVPVILKTDGTIEVVAGTSAVTENIPKAVGTTFKSALVSNLAIAFNPNVAGNFVIAYDSKLLAGTVSGSTLSFGSEVSTGLSNTTYISISFDPNTANKFIVVGKMQYGSVILGTVSGTTVTVNTTANFQQSAVSWVTAKFDPNNANKFVLMYRDNTNSNKGTAIVGTISGTTITFGSKNGLSFNNTFNHVIAFDPSNANTFVLNYSVGSHPSWTAGAIVGTISGTTVTYGAAATYNSSSFANMSDIDFDPNSAGKFIVVGAAGNNSNYGTAVVGIVTGTSIAFGSPVVYHSGAAYYNSVRFNPHKANQLVVAYTFNGGQQYAYVSVGTVSGNAVTFAAQIVINAGAGSALTSISFDPNNANNFGVVYRNGDNSNYSEMVVGAVGSPAGTNITSSNFIGIPNAAYADGETATVKLQGSLATNLSGLTASETYYVQNDGTLDTTADSPSVEAGKALSSTSILLKGI